MDAKRILVIIPAFNEEHSVGEVIEGVDHHLPEADIVVVNDGSRDGTSEKARAGRAIVLDLPFNLGIGGAVQTFDTFDGDLVGTCTTDLGAHGIQTVGQVDYFWFTRGVFNDGSTIRQRRRQQKI